MFSNRSSHPHLKVNTWPRLAAVALVALPFAGGCNRFGFRWRDASQSITVHELDPESQKELDEQLERESGRAGLLAGRRTPKMERDPKKETPREYARVDNSAARSKHLTQSKIASTDRSSARLSDDEEIIEEPQVSIVETNTPEASLAESLERVSPELRKQFELFRQLEAKRSDSIASREDAPSIQKATDSNDSGAKSGLDSKLASNAGVVPAVTTAAAAIPNAEGNAIKLSLNDHANPESATNAVQTAGAVNSKASEVVTASVETPTTNPVPTVLPPKAGQDKDSKGTENENWSRFLAQAIDQLQKEIEATPTADENLRLHQQATLRMLYLANGKLEQSMNKIDGLSAHEQEYFRYQLQALHEATNPDAIPVRSRRWSLVMNNQNKASGHLAAVSNLEIKKVAFCNSVEGYGVYTPFPSMQFKPDQDVLLYCELENVTADEIKEGYETQLQGWYEILDANGSKVTEQLLPMEKEICRNQRRDYFIIYHIYLPSQISSGNYKMQLTIEDMKAKKFGQSHVDFQIAK